MKTFPKKSLTKCPLSALHCMAHSLYPSLYNLTLNLGDNELSKHRKRPTKRGHLLAQIVQAVGMVSNQVQIIRCHNIRICPTSRYSLLPPSTFDLSETNNKAGPITALGRPSLRHEKRDQISELCAISGQTERGEREFIRQKQQKNLSVTSDPTSN